MVNARAMRRSARHLTTLGRRPDTTHFQHNVTLMAEEVEGVLESGRCEAGAHSTRPISSGARRRVFGEGSGENIPMVRNSSHT